MAELLQKSDPYAGIGVADPYANIGQPSVAEPAIPSRPGPLAEENESAPPPPDWRSLYGGLDGIDERLTPAQRSAFAFLDAKTADPKEARAKAINRTFLSGAVKGIPAGLLDANWEAVKASYAKNELGMDTKAISDTALYGAIGKRIKDEADAEQIEETGEIKAPDQMAKFEMLWQKATGGLFDAGPKATTSPGIKTEWKDVPHQLGGKAAETLVNPGNILVGVATAGAGPVIKTIVAKTFGAYILAQTARQAPSILREWKSPDVTAAQATVDTVEASVMALMGVTSMVTKLHATAPKAIKAIEGKTPPEMPAALMEESAKAKTVEEKTAIHQAIDEVQKLTESPPPPPAPAEPTPLAETKSKVETPPPEPPKPEVKADESPRRLVGIKNEAVDEEMRKMGLDPAEHGASLSWEQAKADADAKLAADPYAGQKLVRSLAEKPRPVTGQEDALILTEVNRLSLERDAAEAQLIEAKKTGDVDAIQEANLRIAAARDAFAEASETATKVGTPQAQGLALRRMMMREDYSIASMERQLAAATETGKITPDQAEQIRAMSKHIRETADTLEKHAKKKISDEAKQKMLKGSLRAQIEKPLTAEQQLTRALSVKDRQIEELQRQIDTREPFSAGQKPQSSDPRVMAKQAQIEALKEEREYLRESLQPNAEPPTDIETRAKELDRRIASIDKQLKDEAPFSKGKKAQPSSPEINAQEATLAALKQQREYMRERIQPSPEPKTKAEKALAAYKTRTAKATKELVDRTANIDLAPRPKPEPVALDLEGELLQAAHERAKQDFDRMVLEERIKNRSTFENAQNTLVKWRRGFLLSSPVTIFKLTAAAAWRVAATGAEEAVGSALSKVPGVSKVAEKAPRYGAANSEAMASAIAQATTQGMKDAWAVLKTGKSNLDVIYGKGKDSTVSEHDITPRSIIEYFGNLHGFLKAPVKRMAFTLSLQKRLAFAIRNGVDVSNPMVKMRIDLEAYRDANSAIFLQDNMFTDAYKRGLSAFEQVDPKTGQSKYAAGKLTGTVARTALPIVKVPTNIVGETIEYATGSLTGSWRLGKALRAGVNTLKPEQADLIMRNLQKGSLGAGALLLGYYTYDKVGGQYQQGQKQKPGQAKPGSVMVFDQEIPSYLLHHPILEAVQLGASVRKVAETKLHKKDADAQGLGAGVWAAALGLVEEVPFARGAAEYTKLFDSRERQYEEGQIAKDLLDPQILQWAARVTDMRDGVRVDRKPGTVGEAVKSGLPGLRQSVPEKKGDPWAKRKPTSSTIDPAKAANIVSVPVRQSETGNLLSVDMPAGKAHALLSTRIAALQKLRESIA